MCALTLTCSLNAMQAEKKTIDQKQETPISIDQKAVASTNQKSAVSPDTEAQVILKTLLQVVKEQTETKNLTQEELLQAIKISLEEIRKDQKSAKHAAWATFGITMPLSVAVSVAIIFGAIYGIYKIRYR